MAKDYYKPEDISKIKERFGQLEAQSRKLANDLIRHEFVTLKGKEHALHGFSRRRKILWRCLKNVFDFLPPDLEGTPDSDDIGDATISLHAFYVNVFGACDNLAWVLVYEKEIRKPDGGELPAAWVGLRKGNKRVRKELSDELIAVLDKFSNWFDHIDNFRHSLAHRVPLYVPPYVVSDKNEAEYVCLDKEAWKALRSGDVLKSEELRNAQRQLTGFRPWFTHSFSEKSPKVAIHPQLLADFGTSLEVAEAVMLELNRKEVKET